MTILNHNRNKNRFKRFKRAILYGFLTALVSIPGLIIAFYTTVIIISFPDSNVNEWPYDHFINTVEGSANDIEFVKIDKRYSQALATRSNSIKVQVDLPNDPEVVDILTQNDVDVSIVSSVQPSRFLLISVLTTPFVIVLAGSFLWTWTLIDCATHEAREGNTKTVWVLIIILASWIGALMYLLVRRPQRFKELAR